MARYNGASWHPLGVNYAEQPKMAKYDLIILHTMVGSLSGTGGYFAADGYSGPESHFGVGGDGTVWQWQDTNYRAEANGAANSRAISIETADIGPEFTKWNTNLGSAVPSWTNSQLDSLAKLIAWACNTHSIPCAIVEDSKSNRRGVAYHRLGVPGFAVPGGELWSSAKGKVCPGQRRINQIPSIILAANKLLGNKPGGSSTPKPNPTKPPVLKRRDSVLIREKLEPNKLGGRDHIILPVGDGVLVTERAWINIEPNGPSNGYVKVTFYNKNGAILRSVEATLEATIPPKIFSEEFPNTTVQVALEYRMPEGGTYTIEALARA